MLEVYVKAAVLIASMKCNASSTDEPPFSWGTRPKHSGLNHCQCNFRVVRNRCRLAMEARPTHSGSVESQCTSFSGRLQQTTKLSRHGPKASCSTSIPACCMTPAPRRAKRLKGCSPVVSIDVWESTRPARSSSSRRLCTPPNSSRSSRRASRRSAASRSTGSRSIISAFNDVAPPLPSKKNSAPFGAVRREGETSFLDCGTSDHRSLAAAVDPASSFRTLRTLLRGKFLYCCASKLGPTSSRSRMWMNNEFTLLCPKTLTKRPMFLDQPAFFAYVIPAWAIVSTSLSTAAGSKPPSACGISPKVKALNHCQWRSRVVKNRCRLAIDALFTQ
mmetsp:Transcript_60971/g.145292  ORF Transcript_60971/g.145292 Transcript_60971/m.145292 type:complete len:332 (+) Transcript_60971:1057-2052(+)